LAGDNFRCSTCRMTQISKEYNYESCNIFSKLQGVRVGIDGITTPMPITNSILRDEL
jgi:hypothetical protein